MSVGTGSDERLFGFAKSGNALRILVVTAAAALVSGALALALGTRSADAAPGMEVALQDDPVLAAQSYYNRERALAKAEKLGVTRLRVNMTWSTVVSGPGKRRAPRRIRYNWTQYDWLIDDAARHGIRVQPALTGPAPAWATGDGRVGPYKPSAKHFRAYVKAAAQHFKGRVDRYSIWNEPNHRGWIAPLQGSGKVYRALYATAYSTIKRVDPTAQVLIAETSPYSLGRNARAPLEWLREVTCVDRSWRHARCGELKADGYAHHPYDFDHPPTYRFPGADNVTISTLGRLTGALDKLAAAKALRTPSGRALDVYLTEYGYFASGKRAVPDARRAKYLPQAFEIAQRNRRVRQMLQYLLVQPSSKYRFFDTSILTARGGETRTFKALARWAKDARRKGRIHKFEPPAEPSPGPCTIQPLGIPCAPSTGR
jgi:hypothetical protein